MLLLGSGAGRPAAAGVFDGIHCDVIDPATARLKMATPRPSTAPCNLGTQAREGLLTMKPAVVDAPSATQMPGATFGAGREGDVAVLLHAAAANPAIATSARHRGAGKAAIAIDRGEW